MAETTVTARVEGPATSAPPNAQGGRGESFWRRRAACRGTDPAVFFPAGPPISVRLYVERAKAMCATCPVRARCLDYAIEHDEIDGVWGGLTGAERWQLTAASSSYEQRAR